MDIEQGFDISDLTRLLRRRAWLIGGLALALGLIAIFIAAVLPNEYEATTTLLVEPQSISEELVEAGLPQQDLNSRLHLIQMQIFSRGRLSRVIDDLNLYADESEELTREQIIERMRSKIVLLPVLPSLEEDLGPRRDFVINTFQLHFRHANRQQAADVANRLANDFIEQHIKERVEVSGDTSEFIEAELSRLAERIADIEDRIASVKSENAGRLPEDLESNYRMLERTQESIRLAQRDLSFAESDQSFFRQQSATTGTFEQYARPETSPSRRLDMMELTINEYRSRGFTDKHPDIIAAQGEVDALRAQLAAEQEEIESAEEGEDVELSAGQQASMAEANRAELRADSARAEIARLRELQLDLEQRIGETPRVIERLTALEREHQFLSNSFREFSDKRLDAAVAANMERRQKGEQFRVLEAAYPPLEPVSPNRPLIVAMGLLVGLLFGAGLAFVFEFSDSSYHDARRLQDALRIPVLASVPAVVLASERAAQRRRRLTALFASAALAGVMIAAAVVGNWTVNGAPGPIRDFFGGGQETAAEAEQG